MTPLILLPGMMCDGRLFGPQIAALGQIREVRVAPISGHTSTAALAAEVLAHAPPRFALAGLSMGGIVAMEVLAQAPDRIERLALLDTNPRAELPEVQARRVPQIAAVEVGGLRQVMAEQMIPNYLADAAGHPEIIDLCMAMALDLGPQVFARQSLALRDRPDRQEVLAGVRMPTLILCGRADRLCPVERHELMHGLVPGSTLEIIESAGHLPTLEQPEHTTAALVRWLEA
ncbi:alpha/beta fold hydrolase [uncultured Paracoccus sp.]|uniref:alpha/beta fold hydrolase n=1 Tax=uncultured Paracoccus sp. TaxID=189685 RepID=UPI00262622E2|nr:alpha/beta fold hydrolase [uncultured Paracoccus sp.]